MLNLKKTALAVLALGSSAAFAGSMGPVCSAVNVTVPCESTAWTFGAKALYLKPSLSTNPGIFALAGSPALTAGSLSSKVQPNYNWGFQIEGAYHFNTGNDLDINWYHVSKSKSKTVGGAGAFSINGPSGLIETVTPVSGYASVDPKWDQVNIEVGQHVDFGDNKAIRFHGGAQYSRLANSVTASSAAKITPARSTAISYSQTTTFNPTYNGFGPRVGADLSYDWGNGLGIYANAATAILAGTRSFSTNYTDNFQNSFPTRTSVTAVVPEMDAKLGATYNYALAQGDLTLDAGWMWVNYFNAHSNIAGADSDFSLQGVYFGAKWTGNVA
jgi:hypothetical protein